MPKEITIIKYECNICGMKYGTSKEAISCELKAISQDKKVKVGDVILITGGDGSGKRAKVTKVFVYDKYWGHYAFERYWHTIGLMADIIGEYGSRQLTYDQYEAVES